MRLTGLPGRGCFGHYLLLYVSSDAEAQIIRPLLVFPLNVAANNRKPDSPCLSCSRHLLKYAHFTSSHSHGQQWVHLC
jgi:hypothetical protein